MKIRAKNLMCLLSYANDPPLKCGPELVAQCRQQRTLQVTRKTDEHTLTLGHTLYGDLLFSVLCILNQNFPATLQESLVYPGTERPWII